MSRLFIFSLFKAARLFLPYMVHELKPTSETVNELKAFLFLNDKLGDLKAELPAYIASAEDVSSESDTMNWWKRNELILPHWAEACKRALLVQPSSAAAEKPFFRTHFQISRIVLLRTTSKHH